MATKYLVNSSKNLKNIKKQRGKYPLLLAKLIDISDIILEVLDARFPKEMKNKEIEESVKNKGKKVIYVKKVLNNFLKRNYVKTDLINVNTSLQ